MPNGTIAGELSFPNPTLRNATILWALSGDANANSEVSVRFREQGASAWRRGMDLRRAPANSIGGFAWTDRHSGSLFNLAPATRYEVELLLVDPDGGCALREASFATRPVPAPMPAAPVKAVTPATFSAVLASAQPGDIVEFTAGSYPAFSMSRDGEASKPIVLRAQAGESVVVGGDLVVSNRKYIHVSGFTVNGRIRLNSSQAMSITNNRVNTTGNGIDSALRSEDNYIADNVVIGQTVWAESSLGFQGNNNGEGILVSGPGHVVEHNRVSGFRDCLSTLEPNSGGVDLYSLDFINNDVSNCPDDGVEADYCWHNCRVIGNRFTNVFMMASSQPGYGGPTYFIRNVGYNVVGSAFKLHNGTIGDVLLHNTIVKNGHAFNVNTEVPYARQFTRNNVFIGGPGNTFGVYNSGDGRVIWLPHAHPSGDYDYDGFGSTTGTFTGRLGTATFTSLAELRSRTSEKNAVHVSLAIFADTIAYPSAPFPELNPVDLRLTGVSAAIDAGASIANINDGFTGAGPDLGAHEFGTPLPVYGPR
ncbi:MAG: right-handed parallel beta-helix repeat-containing protein [Bradymonadaceae bacterium]|nr:right-handed parallel beta-helix repeat-containing protein [Lujinxingiaceae bacterium]